MKIRWNAEEVERIAAEIAKSLSPEEPLLPASLKEHIKKAQKIFPPERRHPENYFVGGWRRMVPKITSIIEAKRAAPTPAAATSTLEEKLDRELEQPEPISPWPEQLEEMIGSMAKRFARLIVKETMLEIRVALREEWPKIERRIAEATLRLPKVLVIGPIPRQQRILEEHLEGLLDLRFVSSEDTPALIATRGQGVTHVVVWSVFCSHSHQELARKLVPSDRLIIISGGIHTLRETLENIALSR